MTKSQKIILAKDDAAKDVMGYVAAEDAAHLTFVIPKSSVLLEDEGVWKKLAKVATAMGKEIKIESVDDAVLAGATKAGIHAVNPFFDNESAPAWQAEESAEESEEEADEEGEEDGNIAVEEPVYATAVVNKIRPGAPKPKPKPVYRHKIEVADDEEDDEFTPKRRRISMPRRKWVVAVIVLAIAIPSYWVVFAVLPRASITIVTQKKDWEFNNFLAIEKNGPVPSSVLTEKKNAQMTFPALGKKVVSNKAVGTITVFNAYSSEPQQLVATTRFMTADGKIVRLAKNVTIPGAKIDGGKITASSIEAEIVADKPGPSYNIPATQHLSIPGFKGTAKYAGFYGDITKAMTGGFTREAAYPTDDDVKNAKAKIADVLSSTLIAALRAKAGVDYVLTEGATALTLTKTDVNPQVNAKNEFSVFAEGEMKALVFKESDLIGYFAGKMKADEDFGSDWSFKTTKVAYDVPKVDFAAGKMTLPVDFKGTAELPVDLDAIRKLVMGKSADELKADLFEIPGIGSAEVTLWPMCVNKVPKIPTPEKLTFSVE